jgi:hypothetical protein
MELDAFSSRLGDGQGRIETLAVEASFVLGDLQPGRMFELRQGDYAEVAQTTDLTDVTLVRARCTLVVPAGLPTSLAWEASFLVDGVKLASTTCGAGRARELTDLAANVSKLGGDHEVAIRLTLVGA